MENEPEIRDILMKMYELQKKQYEESKMNAALYRQALAKQKAVRVIVTCLAVVCLGILVATSLVIVGSK